MSAPARHYPVFLDLRGRRCIVVGGGLIAQRKAAGLLAGGAEVVVISPAVTARLAAWARQGRVTHAARVFRAGDLRGAWLAVASTDDAGVNQRVCREAARRRIFANVVDQPALCSFIAPSMFVRGGITVAVGTGGKSPTVAKHVRRRVGRTIGPEYARMLRLLASLRPLARRALPAYAARRRYFDRLMDGPVFEHVRAGRLRQARHDALRALKASA
jgi:siroheme synthase-like protein